MPGSHWIVTEEFSIEFVDLSEDGFEYLAFDHAGRMLWDDKGFKTLKDAQVAALQRIRGRHQKVADAATQELFSLLGVVG